MLGRRFPTQRNWCHRSKAVRRRPDAASWSRPPSMPGVREVPKPRLDPRRIGVRSTGASRGPAHATRDSPASYPWHARRGSVRRPNAWPQDLGTRGESWSKPRTPYPRIRRLKSPRAMRCRAWRSENSRSIRRPDPCARPPRARSAEMVQAGLPERDPRSPIRSSNPGERSVAVAPTDPPRAFSLRNRRLASPLRHGRYGKTFGHSTRPPLRGPGSASRARSMGRRVLPRGTRPMAEPPRDEPLEKSSRASARKPSRHVEPGTECPWLRRTVPSRESRRWISPHPPARLGTKSPNRP